MGVPRFEEGRSQSKPLFVEVNFIILLHTSAGHSDRDVVIVCAGQEKMPPVAGWHKDIPVLSAQPGFYIAYSEP